MPKVTAATIAVTALMLITLTGCAGSNESAGDERTAPAATASAAPLVADEPEESQPEGEAAFAEAIGEALPTNTSIADATEEQLLEAGWEACEMIRSGTDPGDIRLVDGEQPNGADIYADSSAIMNTALLTLCPELIR